MVLTLNAKSVRYWPGPSVRSVAGPLVRLLRGASLTLVAAAGLGRWSTAAEPMPFEFTRMVAHWSDYGHADYLPFIEEARPEIVQVGFYGAHFWSLAHTPQYNGYPVNFPLQGLVKLGDWFEDLNGKLHARGTKVVGHFNVEFLVGDPGSPEGPRGFFKFYRDLWDEDVLGAKPVDDPLQLLERNADGTPIANRTYAIGGMSEYWACLRNPAWQQVLKAWLKHGVDRGLDGFVANYFYRHNCLCEHCQAAFRVYLKDRFNAQELQEHFGIVDIDRHQFSEIVSWHSPAESTPLRREMLRFSQISNKQVFDEVFVRYGRALKPDLIVAQWNHLGDFAQIAGDERCLLPGELWGRDETYAWYSTGDAANKTDLTRGILGEGTLQARYIRGALNDRPFTLGKYEATRIRVAIAELSANGGAPMGFYTQFTDPLARREIVRYYRFLERHDAIYRGNDSHAEVVLFFPRLEVHRGDLAALENFRQLGLALLNEHVLFDVVTDDHPQDELSECYQAVVTARDQPDAVRNRLPQLRSRFTAPTTVRVSASRPAGSDREIDLHFVNYNRVEPPRETDGTLPIEHGIENERPVAVSGIKAELLLPSNARVRAVRFVSPESAESQQIESRMENGRLYFELPEFLVYGVARIELEQ
ncbi:MAG: hypothetical protein K2Y37_09565 [Pirellulales bacterium]|nr:hypothetical protein [Pirellulales bacterium]